MSEKECKELINAELAIAERYIEKLESNNERLREDNFSLASWQCMYTDGSGLTGDETGRQFCRKEEELARLRAELALAKVAESLCDKVDAALSGSRQSGESLDEAVFRLRAEVAALLEFFLWTFEDFPESFPDGFAMQDEAERLGLLVDARPKEPCGEHCGCVEYYSQEEWDNGEVKCLRRATWINAARNEKP